MFWILLFMYSLMRLIIDVIQTLQQRTIQLHSTIDPLFDQLYIQQLIIHQISESRTDQLYI
jgi:hypothetical protein